MQTPELKRARDRAAWEVGGNWRIQKRLPRLTAYAKKMGWIDPKSGVPS
jgi:hypothetical protein